MIDSQQKLHRRQILLPAVVFAGLILLLLVIQGSAKETAVSPLLNSNNELTSTTFSDPSTNFYNAPANGTSNCRYGISSIPWSSTSWMSTFGAGWHLNFRPTRPSGDPGNGAEYVYTLRMQDGAFDPPLSSIDSQLAAYPGSLWLVGSEQEVRFGESGDNTFPEDYAPAYHEAYNYIKQRDPSAQVGVGGMSMATPMRLQYLTKAWDKYVELYNEDMPVDVWNVHIYILFEREWDSTSPGHGQLALGTDPLLGKQGSGNNSSRCALDEVYCIAEHDSLTILQEQTVAFRTWMKDHGQQDKPFMISEIAILYQPDKKDEFGNKFTPERVNAYMVDVFDYLESATDPDLGYPQDNNRLVQQWLWFTMQVPDGYTGRPSNLLVDDWASYNVGDLGALTEVGHQFRNYVQAKSLTVNLKAGPASGLQTADGTGELKVEFYNNGTTSINQPFDVTFYGDEGLTQEIGTAVITPNIDGCGRRKYTAVTLWRDLAPGQYDFWVKVDSGNVITETTEDDNVSSSSVTIEQGGGSTPTTPPETPTAPPETPTAPPETPTTPPETPTAPPETPTAPPETPTAPPETPTAPPATPTAPPETPTTPPETPTVPPETSTNTPSPTPSNTPLPSTTPTNTATATMTTPTITMTPNLTITPTGTITITVTITPPPSVTPSPSATATPTNSATPTVIPSIMPSTTPTPTLTPSPSENLYQIFIPMVRF